MNRTEDDDDVHRPALLRLRQRSDGSTGDRATANPTGVGDDATDPIAYRACVSRRADDVCLGLRTARLRLRGIKPARDGRWTYRWGALLGPGHGLHYNCGGGGRTLKISPATAELK